MIRRFLVDPAGLAARAHEVAAIVRGADRPPLSTLIPVDRYEIEAGYPRWAPRYDAKVPGGTFHAGRLEALPLDDESVDLVTCGLALTHVDDLDPVFAEFARVLRPGGRVVTADLHPITSALGGAAAFPVEDERPDVAAGDSMSLH